MKNRIQTSKREIRIDAAPQKFEIRQNSDGSRTIAGYAVRFNSLSLDLGGFKEKIAPGAFTRSLNDHPDVIILAAHDESKILGRVSSGTAKVTQDEKGVRFSCTLPATSTARDLTALIERGDLQSMSFGFSVVPNGDDWQEVGGQIIRTVNEAIIYELSVVGAPAYESTSVSLRSCPIALRSRLKRLTPVDISDPDDSRDNDSDDDDSCECTCDACDDGRCEDCTNSECDSSDCIGCANQERAAQMDLILRRFRA